MFDCRICSERLPLIPGLLLDLSSMTELCSYHYQQCKTPSDASEAEQTAAESDVFTTRQLMVCISKADFGDEGGRRTVVDMVRGMLQNTGKPPAKPAVA